MKFSFLSTMTLGALVLMGCASAGVNNAKPVTQPVKQLCLVGSERHAPDNFVEYLTNSLKRKNIKAEYVRNNKIEHCQYVLSFKAKGNAKILASASLTVKDMNNNKLVIGSLTYKRKGEEKDRVAQVGLQGQTDLMVNELFK